MREDEKDSAGENEAERRTELGEHSVPGTLARGCVFNGEEDCAAPLATEAKVVELVMAAGTSIITEKSPYIVRTSFTLPQSSVIIADWALKNGIKKAVSIVSDYGPGYDAETFFIKTFNICTGCRWLKEIVKV